LLIRSTRINLKQDILPNEVNKQKMRIYIYTRTKKRPSHPQNERKKGNAGTPSLLFRPMQ
jgi:hypothetical protein